jgi:hypothetical protein
VMSTMMNRFKQFRNGFKLPGYGVEFSRRGLKISRRRTLWDRVSYYAERQPLLFVGALLVTTFVLVLVLRGLFGEEDDGSQRNGEYSTGGVGATEGQVQRSQMPTEALRSGESSTTGAAYGFDPQSITPG